MTKMNKKKIIKLCVKLGIAGVIITCVLLAKPKAEPKFDILPQNAIAVEDDNYIGQPYQTREGCGICQADDRGYYIKDGSAIYLYDNELNNKTLILDDSSLGDYIYGYENNVYAFQQADNKVNVVSINSTGCKKLFEVGDYSEDTFHKWRFARQGDYIYVCNSTPSDCIKLYRCQIGSNDKETIATFNGTDAYFSDIKAYGNYIFYSVSGDTTQSHSSMQISNIYAYNCQNGTTMIAPITSGMYENLAIQLSSDLLWGYDSYNDSLICSYMDDTAYASDSNNNQTFASTSFFVERNIGDDSYVMAISDYILAVIHVDDSKKIYVGRITGSYPILLQYIDIPEDEDILFADDNYIFFSSGKVIKSSALSKATYNDAYLFD